MLTCEKCGADISENDKFCNNCGNVITATENKESKKIEDSDNITIRIMDDNLEEKSSVTVKTKKEVMSIKVYLAFLILVILAFMLFYIATKEKENRIGNSFYNYASGGKATQQGDWIYYSNNGVIYKIRIQGGGIEKVVDEPNCRNLSVIGDYIYCNGYDGNIYKIEINDKSITRLIDMKDIPVKNKFTNGAISLINTVTDKEIYYSVFTVDGTTLYRMDLNGGNIKKIASGYYRILSVDEKYIYCISFSEWLGCSNIAKYRIVRLKRDGSENEVLYEDAMDNLNSVCIDNNILYFVSEGSILYQYDFSSKKKKLVLEKVPSLDMTVKDGWIYYLEDYNIYRTKTASNKSEKITDDLVSSVDVGFYIFDNHIFYTSDKNDYIIMKTDGSEKVTIKSSEH